MSSQVVFAWGTVWPWTIHIKITEDVIDNCRASHPLRGARRFQLRLSGLEPQPPPAKGRELIIPARPAPGGNWWRGEENQDVIGQQGKVEIGKAESWN